MAPLQLLFLAGASLLSLDIQPVFSRSSLTDGRGNEAKNTTCTAEINKARTAVGLSEFKEEKIDFKDDFKSDLEDLCTVLTSPPAKENLGDDDFYMVAPIVDQEKNCEAAVNYWSGLGREIKELPPPFRGAEPPYESLESRSFFTLFSPQPNTALMCVLIKCKAAGQRKDTSKPKASQGQAGNSQKPSGQGGGKAPGKASEKTPASGGPGKDTKQRPSGSASDVNKLVCFLDKLPMTRGVAPFTNSQWAKIKKATSGAVSPMSLAFTAFAVATGMILYV